MEDIKVCELDASLKEMIRKFRFRKETDNAAIIVKLDRSTRMAVLDKEKRDCSLDTLRDTLPDNQPRFILYSYELCHEDGRKSYPLCFIFVSPEGCSPELQMMYTGTHKSLVNEIGATKVFEIRYLEEMSEEWLLEKLSFYH